MASNWHAVALGQICDLFDGPHQTAPLTAGGPVVYLNVGDIVHGRLVLKLSGRVDEGTAARWSRRVVPQPGDVVFGYEATLGEAAVLTAEHRWCLGRRVGLLRPRLDQVESRFLAYAWYSPAFRETLRKNTVGGSTIESIRLTDLPSWTVQLPTLSEQRAITHVLGTLDDKIELNRRMNETLEAMARALFKSWFVDFDPVRAKAEGRDPGLPQPLADLFPDSFEDSELGEIPRGWGVETIGATVKLSREAMDPGAFADEEFEHFSIPAFDAGQVPARDRGGAIKSQKLLVQAGCILVSKLNPGTPRVWMPSAPSGCRQIASTELLVCMGDEAKGMSREFIYSLVSSAPVAEHLTNYASGTSNSHQRVRPADFLNCPVVEAPVPVRHAFTALIKPLLDRIASAKGESTTLAALRDSLLPKLISGELVV